MDTDTLKPTQEAGDKPVTNPPEWKVGPVTPDDLKNLRTGLGLSFADFGWKLKLAMDPKASRPFDKSYIIKLEQGERAITPGIAQAFYAIAAAADGTDPLAATVQQQTVWSAYNIEGCVVLAKPKQCKRPGCRVRFIPVVPIQEYHTVACRLQHWKDALLARKEVRHA